MSRKPSRTVYFRQERAELKLCFISVEQCKATKILPELRLDSNLQEIVFKQDTIVFAHKPKTLKAIHYQVME